MKSSANMFENSDSQFFRTTTGIQSRPDAFDEQRLVKTKIKFLEKFLTNNFATQKMTSLGH